MDNNTSRNIGIGFTGLLTVLFVTLKLIGKIDWSWWWVLSPLWIGAAVFLLVVALIFVVIEICKGIG